MLLPRPRGLVSGLLRDWLAAESALDEDRIHDLLSTAITGSDIINDDDLQLSLWMLYELHYQGFDGVDPDWEWRPELLGVRRRIEDVFESTLRHQTSAQVARSISSSDSLAERLFALVRDAESPPLARYLQQSADLNQLCEFLIHRSIYQLKEGDPHTWVIPRLCGSAKVALTEIQYDEYGSGRPARMHARMFADTMLACALDTEYGGYIDQVPAVLLAGNNAMSLFGLHRRLRGAAIGHLGALEASSSLPNRRYAMALRRLGVGEVAARYFDEHVEADAVHEQLAVRDVCSAAAQENPELVGDIIMGATVCLHLDAMVAEHLLGAWSAGETALRADGVGAARTRA